MQHLVDRHAIDPSGARGGGDVAVVLREQARDVPLLELADHGLLRVLERLRTAEASDELSALTPQERKLIDLIAEGLTNRQIGDRMFLAEKTVKNYVSNLLAKLGMSRRTEAAVYAARLSERRAQGRRP